MELVRCLVFCSLTYSASRTDYPFGNRKLRHMPEKGTVSMMYILTLFCPRLGRKRCIISKVFGVECQLLLVQNSSLKWDCEKQNVRKYCCSAEFRVKGVLSERVEEGQCSSSCVGCGLRLKKHNGTVP